MSLKIEIFSSPGCAKCGHAKEVLRKLAEEIGGEAIEWREVNVLDDMDRAVEKGVLSTPAITIDDVLVFSGLPSANKLRRELESRLSHGQGSKA